MSSGWIKIHRRITNKGYYKNSKYIHLWIHILLRANHKESEIMWNKEIVIIKEGQFITGRKQLSEETGINESAIERILKMLENEHQIEQQKTTKFRLITIVNWKEYQANEQQNEQQMNNKRTTDEQQMNTNKNIKKKENGENEKNTDLETIKEIWNNFAKKYNLSQLIKLTDKRKSGILNRKAEKEFDLDKILANVSDSPFLLGENKEGWKVDFDFIFTSKNNYLKILEGKYNGKPKAAGVYAQHITKDKLQSIAEDIRNDPDLIR